MGWRRDWLGRAMSAKDRAKPLGAATPAAKRCVCACARASVFFFARGPRARDRGAPRPQPGRRAPCGAAHTLWLSPASISGVGGLQHGRPQRCRCSSGEGAAAPLRSSREAAHARAQGGFGRAAGALSRPREPNEFVARPSEGCAQHFSCVSTVEAGPVRPRRLSILPGGCRRCSHVMCQVF